VTAVVEVELTGAGETQVRLVDERRRVEQRVPAPDAEPRPSQAAQLGIHHLEQPIGRIAVAAFGPPDQLGYFGHLVILTVTTANYQPGAGG
jgi:hypothetical protein